MVGYHDLSMLSVESRKLILPYLTGICVWEKKLEDLTVIDLIAKSHATAVSKGWWDEDLPNEDRGFGMMLMLMVTELSEALEEYRNGRDMTEIYYSDDQKPEGIPVELADVVIRIADLCGGHDVPLLRAIQEKLEFNKTRPIRHGGKRA